VSECWRNLKQLHLRKRLGQHILVDERYIELFTGAVGEARVVYEIGCGLGSLTLKLAKRVEYVFCSEIDPNMVFLLKECVKEVGNADIVLSDATKLALSRSRHVVVSNTPFNLSSEIVLLLCRDEALEYAILGVQREVGERLLAQPTSRNYGRLSVVAQLCFSIDELFIIPSRAYVPRPKVETMVVRMVPTRMLPLSFIEHLEAFTRKVFPYRRKKLQTGLSLGLGIGKEQAREILSQAGIDPDKRVYEVSPWDFVKIVKHLPFQT